MNRQGGPPRSPPQLDLELGDSWPPRAVIRPNHSSYREPPAQPSVSPPGLKRHAWLKTWLGSAVVLLVAGWKARDMILDYPVRTEISSMVAAQVKTEREERELAERTIRDRVTAAEDAGARTAATLEALGKQVDGLDKRKRPAIVSPLRP